MRDIDINPAGIQPAPDAAVVEPSLNMPVLGGDNDIGVAVRHLILHGKPGAHRANLPVSMSKRTGIVITCKKSKA